ncbi:UNVERIFIED_CONTAM: hypothetical protein Cloal_2973 [Acetivibrio alkalicellulosi]
MKKILFSFILILLCFLIPIYIYGDGMAFKRHEGVWSLLDEEHQLCAIHYEDNRQNMILAISVGDNLDGEEASWIFPVPSTPENVNLGIVKGFPDFVGRDVKVLAKSNISEMFYLIRSSQIYPLFYIFDGYWKSDNSSNIIHQSVREMGLASDLISSSHVEPLLEYLNEKGFDLDEEYISILDDYIGEEYSFVVSWIYDVEEFKKNQENNYYDISSNILGVNLSFPTDKLYFPLKPTSAYGNMVVPATIYVTEFVTPKLFEEILPYTEVNYFNGSIINLEALDNQVPFYKNSNKRINYTQIQIKAPSNMLKEDLWIDVSYPSHIKFADFINKNNLFIYGFIIFLLISLASGLISGIIYSFRSPIPKYKLLLLGLSNIFSIAGVFFASKLIIGTQANDDTYEYIYNNKQAITKNFNTALFVNLSVSIIAFLYVFISLTKETYYFNALSAFVLILILFIIQVLILSKESTHKEHQENTYYILNLGRFIYLLSINFILPLLIIGTFIFSNSSNYFWFDSVLSIGSLIIIACLNIFSLSTLIIFNKNLYASRLGSKCLHAIPKNESIKIALSFTLTFILLSYVTEFLIKFFI